ncbi:MAG: hypothetical protein K9H25_18865 [Rhodospirillum sp.]|nr:hypothetical protein [Rhodospirillum sp.]MCF8491554.1 hypothetical protein [Rhodospirillum sp.]MCF8501943.1 hypothetical protein [Rhodospirillum sp.]
MIGKLFSQGLMGVAVVAFTALTWSVARSAEAPSLAPDPGSRPAVTAPAGHFSPAGHFEGVNR